MVPSPIEDSRVKVMLRMCSVVAARTRTHARRVIVDDGAAQAAHDDQTVPATYKSGAPHGLGLGLGTPGTRTVLVLVLVLVQYGTVLYWYRWYVQ
jgi:hypothetical protein